MLCVNTCPPTRLYVYTPRKSLEGGSGERFISSILQRFLVFYHHVLHLSLKVSKTIIYYIYNEKLAFKKKRAKKKGIGGRKTGKWGFPIFLFKFSTPISVHETGHQELCIGLKCPPRTEAILGLQLKGREGWATEPFFLTLLLGTFIYLSASFFLQRDLVPLFRGTKTLCIPPLNYCKLCRSSWS